jgi:tRNA G10  N-methylase Trm11
MAGLFKNKIIKENLKKFEIPDFEEKIKIIQGWNEAYQNGSLQNKTETQCEQSFNSDIFIKVLGYTSFPKKPYTIQPKDNVESGGGQIPDATLGYFNDGSKRVIAVVEIKDANTSLDKSQHREGNLSPVQQAFKYKPLFKECGFVIATNFVEIRLFRDNQLDYEKFTLTELVDSKDNYFHFRKFYYLLSVNNFITEKGQTETEKLLSAIRIEQEEITNKFYKEYKQLREDLIKDIVDENKGIKRIDLYNTVVEKAQKIVDRIVFICFFEDSGLLPEGKLAEVVDYAQKGSLSEPIWETMKKFFKAVDEGSEKLGVPHGYNGELFKNDDDLNKLKISDKVCNKFVALSKYDFDEDLSVNILGHIFEQSITDLERLKRYSEKKELESKDSKRKKDGIYYTPEYIVDYIIKNSLGKYLEEKEQEIFDKHKLDSQRIKKNETYDKKILQAYQEYKDVLCNIKILDPACGSGAFLVKVFDFLLSENKRVAKVIADIQGNASLYDTEDYVKSLLQNNIYGVDLNPESVEITKLSLWLKSAQRGQKLITLKGNIKCGNSLIDDPNIAGEKAFSWSKEFSEIINNGGFDVIIGNPPYIRPHNLLQKDKEFFWKNYKAFQAKSDIYAIFIEKAISLLKTNGYLCFIAPHTWFYLESFKPLRDLVLNENNLYKITKTDKKVFSDAQVDTAIFVIKKHNQKRDTHLYSLDKEGTEINLGVKRINNAINFSVGSGASLLQKIEMNSEKLGGVVEFYYGFKTADDDKFLTFNPKNLIEYKKILRRSDFGRYTTDFKGEHIFYRPDLMIKNKKTARPGDKERFENKKIIAMDIAKSVIATIDYDNFYIKDALIFIDKKDSNIELEYILGLINSSLLRYYYSEKFKVISVAKNAILDLPIKITEDYTLQKQIIKLATEIVNMNKEFKRQLYQIAEILRHQLVLEKLPTKLNNFYELSFDEIIKISKTQLNLEKKSELLNFIEKNKQKLIRLKEYIQSLDNEIDQITYKIYNLSDEEIKQIEDFKLV